MPGPQSGQPIATRPTAAGAVFSRRTVALISGAHFVHDSYPSFVGVLLPVLIPKLGLSLGQAGLLVSGIRWTTAIQPLLGYIADGRDTRYWVIVAPATTGIVISLIGIAPGFLAVFLLLMLAGVSHAAFHPAAAGLITRVSGDRWGRGASYFMTGGELGRALGPLFIAAVLTAFGLGWSWIALFPGVVCSLFLYGQFGHAKSITFSHSAGNLRQNLRQVRGVILLLSAAVLLRSVANVAVTIFLPTLLVGTGAELFVAGAAITAYELGGTAGAFVGGTASDRFGRRAVLATGLLIGLPLLAGSLFLPPGPLQLAGLSLAGLALLSGMPVQLVTMHELLPDNRGIATGLTYFMTTGGAIASAILIGATGDAIGLRPALLAAITVATLAIPAVLLLPGSFAAASRQDAGHEVVPDP